MDSKIILSYQNLHTLEIEECLSLENLFPVTIVKGLEKLEKLYVRMCRMEEIIEEGDEFGVVTEFVFPRLKTIELYFIKDLKSFYSGLYISKWPMLEELIVWGCWDVEQLALDFESYDENQHNVSSEQPLFLVDKVHCLNHKSF